MCVVLRHRISSSVLRLQSQEFVACFFSNQRRLANLGRLLVPDFQGALRFFEQSLILATDRCIDGESFAHVLLPSLKLEHFVRQQRQVVSFGDFETENCFSERGSSTQKEAISPILLVLSTQSELQVSSTIDTHDRSMRLNFQPLTKSNMSLERKLPFQ